MVLKAKSEVPIKPIRNVKSYSAWNIPSLDGGTAPGFRQPKEELEEEEVPLVEKISEQELHQIKENARKQGYDAGYAEGLKAGQDEIEKKSVALEMLMSQLTEPLAQIGEKTRQQLMELAFAIAKQILRREIQQEPTQLIAIIREAIQLLPVGSQKIKVRLNAEDAQIIKQALNINLESEDGRWQLVADPGLGRGGCKIETDISRVDASIEKQAAIIFSRIVGGQRSGEADAQG